VVERDPPEVLTVGRIFGVRSEGFLDGRALAGLAWIGSLVLGLGFVAPVTLERWSRGYRFAWHLWSLEGAPVTALALPLLLVVVGAIAAMPRLSAAVRAGLLFAAGLAGLWSLGVLGPFAACARRLFHPLPLGALLIGSGLILRLYEPYSRPARAVIGSGLAVLLIGYFTPTATTPLVPQEMLLYARYHGVPLGSPPFVFFVRMLGARGGPTLLHAVVLLLPLVTGLAATLLAWPRPRGSWDLAGRTLRVMTWALVLAIPLGYAVGMFLMMGFSARLAEMALVGRMRMLTLSVPLVLWTVFGAARLARR
jgi:hypothetical protein